MHQPEGTVNADEEFYRIAVCEKIACTVRRRGTGVRPCLYSTRAQDRESIQEIHKGGRS